MSANLLREAAREIRADHGEGFEFMRAVADWLEMTADAHSHEEVSGRIIDVWSLPGMDKHPAVAVARAYMGRDA
jgi:hypothetical protein